MTRPFLLGYFFEVALVLADLCSGVLSVWNDRWANSRDFF